MKKGLFIILMGAASLIQAQSKVHFKGTTYDMDSVRKTDNYRHWQEMDQSVTDAVGGFYISEHQLTLMAIISIHKDNNSMWSKLFGTELERYQRFEDRLQKRDDRFSKRLSKRNGEVCIYEHRLYF